MLDIFIELLKNGEINPFRFGDSRRATIDHAGEPDGEYHFGEFEVLKYGGKQVYFENGQLVRYVHNAYEPISVKLCGQALEFSTNTTIEQFISLCDTFNISWRIDQQRTFDRQLCIATNARTSVIFDLDQMEFAKIEVGAVPD